MSRRLLIIIIGLVVILGILIGAFFVTSRPNQQSNGTLPGNISSDNGQLPPPAGENISNDGNTTTDGGTETNGGAQIDSQSLSDLPLLGRIGRDPISAYRPVLSADAGHIWYFDREQKKFIENSFDGRNPHIFGQINKAFERVADIFWSPFKDSFIIEQTDSERPFSKKTYVKIENDEETELNQNIDAITFSPDGDKIYYQYIDAENNIITLNIADANGENFRVIKDFPIQNLDLAWIPGVERLMFNLAPSGYRRSTFYVHDENGENVLSLMEKGYGVEGIWSPRGTRILATWAESNSNKLHLRAVSIKGTELRDMSDIQTFIDKCVWSQDPTEDIYVYCAVPRSIPGSAVLPEDYQAGKLELVDDIYKINTKTGEKFLIAESTQENPIDATDLTLISDGENDQIIYFTNRNDEGSLWALNLGLVQLSDGQ